MVVRHVAAGQIAVEAAFDQQRARVAGLGVGQAEATVVAQPRAVLVAGIHDDVRRRTHLACQIAVARLHTSQQQRGRGLVHGMQVQQPVGLLHEGAQRGGAAAFAGAALVDACVYPLAVHVLVHEARGIVAGRVEAVEGIEVGQHQGQAAVVQRQAVVQGLKQPGHGPGAADLVAVHQRGNHHVAARASRVELPHALGTGIARAPGAQVGQGKVKLQSVHGWLSSRYGRIGRSWCTWRFRR